MKKLFGFFALFILLGSQTAWAQMPVAIQGLAIDSKGVPVPDGNKNITFFIYDSPDGKEPLWSEQQMIPIEDGIFRVMLGEVNAFDLPLDEKPLWLGMKVDDGEELSPRMQLASSEFTLTAKDGKGDLSPSRSTKVAADRDGAGVNEDEFVTANPDKLTKSANPDIVHNDDVIIIGSLCVGFDCVNGESFGFDTIRLKENNLRIRFDDTSTTASFPRNDWEIRANDSSNGGASYLAFADITGGRTPFRVEAGARSNALTVDAQGDIGIGLLNAATDIHVKTGDTPTLRLEQDGTSGFTPQTWDIASNETNFFIRDVTMGSRLPFRIRPGAPTSSIDIQADGSIDFQGQGANAKVTFDSDGNVGIGTTTPTGALHLQRNGLTVLRFENTAGPALGDVWDFQVANGGGFQISAEGSGMVELLMSPAGLLTLSGYGAGTLMTDASGNVTASSDIRLKNIEGDFVRGLSAILQLEPISYKWKQETGFDTENTYSGFSAQNVRDAIPEATSTDNNGYLTLSDRPIVATLVNAVKELNAELEQTRDQNVALRAELDGIKATLSQLHAILQLPVGATPEIQNADVQYLDVFRSRVNEYLEGVDENGRLKGSAQLIELKEN